MTSHVKVLGILAMVWGGLLLLLAVVIVLLNRDVEHAFLMGGPTDA